MGLSWLCNLNSGPLWPVAGVAQLPSVPVVSDLGSFDSGGLLRALPCEVWCHMGREALVVILLALASCVPLPIQLDLRSYSWLSLPLPCGSFGLR